MRCRNEVPVTARNLSNFIQWRVAGVGIDFPFEEGHTSCISLYLDD